MFGPLASAGIFIIQTLFDVYILLLMLRVLLAYVGAEVYNPIVQLFIKLTDPVIKPLRKIIPRVRVIDVTGIVAVVIFTVLKFISILLIQFGGLPNVFSLMMLCLGDIIRGVIYIFMVSIFIRILLSWFAPQSTSPAIPLLYQLTKPLMAPARRLIKPMSGLDFSPIIVLLLLQVIAILVSGYIG